jgi:hypothetical protein
MTWDRFTRAVCFVLGVCLVIAGFTIDPVRGTEVVIGLILMGIISIDQVRKWSTAWASNGNGNGYEIHHDAEVEVTEGMHDPSRPTVDEPPL